MGFSVFSTVMDKKRPELHAECGFGKIDRGYTRRMIRNVIWRKKKGYREYHGGNVG